MFLTGCKYLQLFEVLKLSFAPVQCCVSRPKRSSFTVDKPFVSRSCLRRQTLSDRTTGTGPFDLNRSREIFEFSMFGHNSRSINSVEGGFPRLGFNLPEKINNVKSHCVSRNEVVVASLWERANSSGRFAYCLSRIKRSVHIVAERIDSIHGTLS